MNHLAMSLLAAAFCHAQSLPTGATHENSLGMKLVRIEPGSFRMGADGPLSEEVAPRPFQREGDFDEKPAHQVRIGRAFYLGATEVTNRQYEQFDPAHRTLRGKLGFSKADDEAVVFVSWHDAVRFIEWLSKKEKLPYRLPTEAEWEYAARAGTTTPFHTGAALPAAYHKNQRQSWLPDMRRGGKEDPVDLTVGRTSPNAWGLFDIHGNVEEWCADWYGPYEAGAQTDPVGRASGDFRVTRGGSHSTEVYYLRSANRAGALPEDKHWLIGFRVALGAPPKTRPLPPPPPPLNQQNVRQTAAVWKGPDPNRPYFRGPRQFMKIAPENAGPLFWDHNHDTALAECPNGDLLAIWFTCTEEPGREMTVAASRLRRGADEWEPASLFWDPPDRNDSGPALWFDGKKTLYHFNGLSAAATWGNLATILRTSTDNGATWSKARLISPEHGLRNMPAESVIRTREGHIVLAADAVTVGQGGTALHISRDEGKTWQDAGGKAAGIHAGIVQLKDGRLMALGRGDDIDGRMPKSVSADMGKTWTTSASEFQPISSGQRLVLTRLREGPLLLVTFAKDMPITDASGRQRKVNGMFAALSFDEGETWPAKRVVSDDQPDHPVETLDAVVRPGGPRERQYIQMGIGTSEWRAYLSVCQTPDGVIHLISSRQHYEFNLAWLKTPGPAAPAPGN